LGPPRVKLPAMEEELLWILGDQHNHYEVTLEDLWAMSEPHNHNQVAGERR